MPTRFDTGGELGPIEGRDAREDRLKRLPPDAKELAGESARLADLCQYFSAKRMDMPPQILDQVGGLSRLPLPDRIRALKDINQALMEYLNRVGEDPQLRQ
ncbi:MAG: hypothetical protein LAO56_22865 [Acidobacteriia bacterium]|nr:hypothetical protein [Terriglobia bacterium]